MLVESSSPTAFPAADRTQKTFQAECVELFAEMVHIFGVPKSVGQIYGVLYASSKPLSFSDIVEQIDISKGSASQGLQLLRSLGAITVAEPEFKALSDKRKAGSTEAKDAGSVDSKLKANSLMPHAGDANSRRLAYEPELSLRKLMSGILQERITPLAAAGADRLARLRELAEKGGEGSDFYLDRVKQLKTWRRRLKTLLPVLSVMLGPKSQK